jgi:hypothetical protein
MASGPIPNDTFRFNMVCIMDSMPSGEAKVAEHLEGFVAGQLEENRLHAVVRRDRCESANSFRRYVAFLTAIASSIGVLPLLHIEAHGSPLEGLYFADESQMSWPELCEVLAPLNRASNFCLMVVLATCYGADLISGIFLSRPAPWYAMVGTTSVIESGEVMRNYRAFYRAALRTRDMVRAGEAIAEHPLEYGDFVILSASYWFDLLMSRYLQNEATPQYVRDFALRRHRALKSQGLRSRIGDHKRAYRQSLPDIVRRYFETFFMLDLPESARRFGPVWVELQPYLAAAVRRI